jgi:hypothetical protein
MHSGRPIALISASEENGYHMLISKLFFLAFSEWMHGKLGPGIAHRYRLRRGSFKVE